MQTRDTIISGINITIPSTFQPNNDFPVMSVLLQVVRDDKGDQIGRVIQQQQPMIASDFTPEVLGVLNGLLAHLGLALTPTPTTQAAGDA